MSYILDALRKSEHERQMSAGQIASLLYPIEIENKRSLKPWLILMLLALIALVTFALAWWIWYRPSVTDTSMAIHQAVISADSRPPAITGETLPEPNFKQGKLISEQEQKKYNIPSRADNLQKSPARAKSLPSTPAVNSKTAGVDPIKDLPPLNITGYIHNQQSGSLAMINNQLVQEGDEVSPGLRLVKILDDKAIFDYKGYVFSLSLIHI